MRQNDLFDAVRAGDEARVLEILKEHSETATARDSDGATALHYAAEKGDRDIVHALLAAGADINARDLLFNATPTGWAIEYLRQRGGLLSIEIKDAAHAIKRGDVELVERYLLRFPALRDAAASDGTPLKVLAKDSGNREIAGLLGV